MRWYRCVCISPLSSRYDVDTDLFYGLFLLVVLFCCCFGVCFLFVVVVFFVFVSMEYVWSRPRSDEVRIIYL